VKREREGIISLAASTPSYEKYSENAAARGSKSIGVGANEIAT
jgi:hypothetical protein